MTPPLIEPLQDIHPLFVEGMGSYDKRDPRAVASAILPHLQQHWRRNPPRKPILLVTQGDPYEEQGIAAITRGLADLLDVPRGLIYLDFPHTAYHRADADRYRVTWELPYSFLHGAVTAREPSKLRQLETEIDRLIEHKNTQRHIQGKPPLRDYYRDFVCLQEISKSAAGLLCQEMTLLHTAGVIDPFSVASFFETGVKAGLVAVDNIVSFSETR